MLMVKGKILLTACACIGKSHPYVDKKYIVLCFENDMLNYVIVWNHDLGNMRSDDRFYIW